MRKGIALLTLGLLITSCSPGGGQTPAFGSGVLPGVASQGTAATTQTGTVKVSITVPARPALRSHYVSPSTKSIVVKADSAHGKLLATVTQNLSPGTKGCKNAVDALICTFEFIVPAGKDRFSATTYDAPKGKGDALSALSNFARTVKAGKTVKLPLTLDGIVKSVSVELSDESSFATGDAESGFQFAGLIAHTMQVAGLDAGGNVIVAPGAPTVGLTSSDMTNVMVAAVSGTTNEFLLTPHGDASGITLTASAKPAKGAAVQASAGLSIASVLYVANFGTYPGGNVTAYAPWSPTPIETISGNNPAVLFVDGSGNLWVGNNAGNLDGSIVEYAPGSTTPSRTISGVTTPNTGGGESLAVDKHGNLYCACNQANEVDIYTPADTTPSRSLTPASDPTGISTPFSVVVDSSDNLYVANQASNTIGISVFAPGASTHSRNITNGIHGVWLLALDGAGNLYAGNYSTTGTITKYAPGGSTVVRTFGSTSGISLINGVAVDRSGNVYSANYINTPNDTVTEFTAASFASPARTLTLPGAGPYAVATDPLGNVYAPVLSSNDVVVFPPGTGTTASRTLTAADGINAPWYVATWP